MLSGFSTLLQEKAMNDDVDGVLSLIRPKIRNKCMGILQAGNGFYGIDLDDITQEIEIKVWRNFGKYNPKRACFNTFVNQILNSTMKDLYKHAGRLKNQINNSAIRFDNFVTLEETGYTLHDVLGTCHRTEYDFMNAEFNIFKQLNLTEHERVVISLRQKDVETAKIAKILGISRNRVSQILASARSKWANADENTGGIDDEGFRSN